jgi:hypothetical protein
MWCAKAPQQPSRGARAIVHPARLKSRSVAR